MKGGSPCTWGMSSSMPQSVRQACTAYISGWQANHVVNYSMLTGSLMGMVPAGPVKIMASYHVLNMNNMDQRLLRAVRQL
eukprot:3318798-Prorocentrum_lima.AAC.1